MTCPDCKELREALKRLKRGLHIADRYTFRLHNVVDAALSKPQREERQQAALADLKSRAPWPDTVLAVGDAHQPQRGEGARTWLEEELASDPEFRAMFEKEVARLRAEESDAPRIMPEQKRRGELLMAVTEPAPPEAPGEDPDHFAPRTFTRLDAEEAMACATMKAGRGTGPTLAWLEVFRAALFGEGAP